MDAACEGENLWRKSKGANKERYKLRASLHGKNLSLNLWIYAEGQKDTVLNFVLFQDAKLNEVDSGTELDSQGEEEADEAVEKDKAEEPAATKDEDEKKED